MLLGLQSNALKFTPNGYIKIKVKIVEENEDLKEGKMIEISVEDSGIGISDENQ